MGLDPASDRSLTLTGGLPYFGGPGNNYSMHGIAEAVQRVRAKPGSHALVIANGGYLSKHSAGVYGPVPAGEWQSVDTSDLQQRLRDHGCAPVTETPDGDAVIETYVAAYRRGEPAIGYIVGRQTSDAQRFLAVPKEGDAETLHGLFATGPMGRHVQVDGSGAVNTFRFAAD